MPYQGLYDPWLVVASVMIAIMAAFGAFSISSRMAASTSWQARWAWASAGACSMGGGIWGMHFIGMLAFSLPCGVSYDPLGTLLSMIPGILASGVALHVIGRVKEPGRLRLIVGAVLMGAGIARNALLRDGGDAAGCGHALSAGPRPRFCFRRCCTCIHRAGGPVRAAALSGVGRDLHGARRDDHGRRGRRHALHRDAGVGLLSRLRSNSRSSPQSRQRRWRY